ncbi:MAG: hypothetical protein ACI965_000800 [Paraglaciecola sp.]|jgi:hypothetical protein
MPMFLANSPWFADMSDSITSIIQHLHAVSTMREMAEQANILETIRAVQNWQCQRLLLSHQEMYQQKRFKPAVEFFVNELYGPRDFSQRDHDIARVVPKMAKLLPEKALISLASALHLNALSFELDFAIARKLHGLSINRDSYARAYRDCNNQAQRQQQISYIKTLGGDLADVVRMKGISTLLMLSRKPAKLAGVISLHEFLEHGFKAFKSLGEVEDFINPVANYEQTLLTQLFDKSAPNPLPQGI